MLRLTCSAFVFWVACPCLAIAQPFFDFFEPVSPPRALQVVAHHGMTNAAPANSAAAIEMSIEDYCEWVEIDVRLSKDGQHVIFHSETIDSTTNGKGRVADLTVDELKQLDCGAWFAKRFAGTRMLTLSDALSIAKGKANLILDCKLINAPRLVEEILAAGMERQVLIDAAPHLLTQIKATSKGKIAVMAQYEPKTDFDTFVKEIGPAAVAMDVEDISTELCQRFHAAGIKVQAQVLGENTDKPEVWGRVIDAGADWILSDHPARVLFFSARRRLGKFPVMIACHRGASRYAPENTIEAIREAAELGVDFAEIDIRTTKDGQTILMHDGTVNRTTPKKGLVRDFTYEELIVLSAGAWFGSRFQDVLVPSFDEGLKAYGPEMSVYLDSKDISPEALVAAIQKHGIAQRHTVYQSIEYCEKLKKLDPSVRTMPALRKIEDLKNIVKISPYAVDANWLILSKEMIAECHRHGIKVFADALNSYETIENYTKAIGWGIDCIQTDRPLRVLRAIELISKEQRNR